MAEFPNSFQGYRRENGRVGVRNHVVILPLDDISNAASEAVANNIKGTMAIPHAYGRLQFGEDLDLHRVVVDRHVQTIGPNDEGPNRVRAVEIDVHDVLAPVGERLVRTGPEGRVEQHEVAHVDEQRPFEQAPRDAHDDAGGASFASR